MLEETRNKIESIDAQSGNIIHKFNDWLGDEVSIQKAIAVYFFLGIYFIWFFVPIIWLLLSTIKPAELLQLDELILIPSEPTLSHYQTVLTDPNYRVLFRNSFIVTLGTCLLTMVLSIFGAYSLSRYEYPGRQTILMAFLSSKMLPLALVIIPFYGMMYTLGFVDTYIGIILAHTIRCLPLAMWLLKGFFDDIPKSFDEAARLDGCSHIEVLRYVILPLSIPGLAVALFYTFITSWNEFLFVSVLAQTLGTRTLPAGLYLFMGTQSVNWGAVLAAAVLTALPPVILFTIVSRQLVSGFSIGGMHGQ